MNSIRRITFPRWTVWLALLLLCGLTFGLMLPRLGYYWDDWAKILVSRLFGLSGYWAYYAGDRPLSAWTHILLTPILGARPLPWHVFSLLMRWLTGLGISWSLGALWPHARKQAVWVAALFLVFPVFTQQPIALTFHQQWLQYALFFLSIGATIQAVRRPRGRLAWTALALVASALQLTVTEYFVGLELIRPLILWLLLGQEGGRFGARLRRWLGFYGPYLLLFLGYVIWRLFFIRLTGADPYRAETLYSLFSDPAATLSHLAGVVARDSYSSLVSVWAQLIDLDLNGQASRFYWLALVGGLVVAAIFIFYLNQLNEAEPSSHDEYARWIRQAVLLGLVAFLCGMLPAWLTGREALEDFHGNRYALPAAFGASLLSAGALAWFIRGRLQRVLSAALLIGLAIFLQLRVANDFRWIWTEQTRFYWQLAWRAPYILPQTAILSKTEPFPNQGLFSTSAALNLLYPQPQPQGEHLAYWMYTLLPRYAANVPSPHEISYSTRFRTLSFSGMGPNSLLVYNDSSRANCLWVLGPDDLRNPDLSDLERDFLAASNLERISPQPVNADYPPEEMFGSEPERQWCYHFEKAELANQFGNYEQAAGLGEEALAMGYTPLTTSSNSPREWLPFIEAFIRVGQVGQARDLTEQALIDGERYRPMLCAIWQRAGDATASAEAATVIDQLGCSQPHPAPTVSPSGS